MSCVGGCQPREATDLFSAAVLCREPDGLGSKRPAIGRETSGVVGYSYFVRPLQDGRPTGSWPEKGVVGNDRADENCLTTGVHSR